VSSRVFPDPSILPIGPQGTALLAVLQPGEVVITSKLDRVFRSALDALDVLGRMKQRNT
jgi:hypothetical protein